MRTNQWNGFLRDLFFSTLTYTKIYLLKQFLHCTIFQQNLGSRRVLQFNKYHIEDQMVIDIIKKMFSLPLSWYPIKISGNHFFYSITSTNINYNNSYFCYLEYWLLLIIRLEVLIVFYNWSILNFFHISVILSVLIVIMGGRLLIRNMSVVFFLFTWHFINY